MKNIDETRNYFVEELEQNELMNKKYEKTCTTLNYIEHLLILASTVTWCISISAFPSLVRICTITTRTKSITKYLRKRKISTIKYY